MLLRRSCVSMVLALALPWSGGVEAQCTCDEARRHNGWCEEHDAGYVAGVRITSEAVFEALDAHGHHVPRARLHCERCLEAHDRGNGYCEEHRMGFVDGVAYLSPLNYYLARGRLAREGEIDCPVCRENAASHGWCERCDVGRVGPFVIAVREEFEEIERALVILHAATETATRCETCAVAMLLDGTCSACGVSYQDGRKTDAEPR